MESKRKFIGKINAVKRYDLIIGIILVEILAFFILKGNNEIISVISVIVALYLIIWVLLKINLQNDILIFEEHKILFKQKDKITEYEYKDVVKNEFVNQQSNQSFVRITLKEIKFNYILDTESELDFKIEDFADFILSKNKSIEFLIKQTNFQTYKYFKNGEEIRRVLIN